MRRSAAIRRDRLHPLSTSDPDRPAQSVDDVTVADLQPKLTRFLDRARALHRLAGAARPPLWVTELNWTSADVGGVITAQQQVVIGRAMLRLQQAGAQLVLWQFVTDPPIERTGGTVRAAGLTIPVSWRPAGAPWSPEAVPGRVP